MHAIHMGHSGGVTSSSYDIVLMWKDLWLGSILEETHPRAFSFAKHEDCPVRDFLGTTVLVDAFHLALSLQAFDEIKDLQ